MVHLPAGAWWTQKMTPISYPLETDRVLPPVPADTRQREDNDPPEKNVPVLSPSPATSVTMKKIKVKQHNGRVHPVKFIGTCTGHSRQLHNVQVGHCFDVR